MDKFKTGEKVIAITDAPIIDSKVFGNGTQAYKKGDIFEVRSKFANELVFFIDKYDTSIACNADNFKSLSKFRGDKISKILC